MTFDVQCKELSAVFPHPIVKHGVLGHAVGSTKPLHSASIVAVQHLLPDAVAVAAGMQRIILVPGRQVVFEEKLTVWKTNTMS